MVNKTLAILKKNFQILFNAKLSSLIFILGPIILILIIGAAMSDTSIKNITAGVYVDEQTEFTQDFIDKMKKRSFEMNKERTLDKCEQNVRGGETDVCIHIKKANLDSFNGKMSPQGVHDIDLYVDFSRQRIVWNIIGTIKEAAEKESEKSREEMVLQLKNSVDSVLGDLEKQKQKIDLALKIIRDIDNTLDEISENQERAREGIEEDVEDINQRISSIESSLESLKNSGLLDEEHASDVDSALDSISAIDSSLDSISNSLERDIDSEREIEKIQHDYINEAENELRGIKDSIEDIEIDLEEIKSSDLERIADPVQVSYSSVLGSEKGSVEGRLEFLDYLFPNFLMFFILFSSIIYSTINVIKERKSNSYIRNITSNTRGINFVISQLVSSMFIVLLQILIIIFIADFFINLSLFSNLLNLLAFLLLSIFVFSLIGTLLGYIFNSQESSIIGAISVSLIFFMFSSIIAPVETLPSLASGIVSFAPFALLETKLRFLLIFDSSLSFTFFESLALFFTIGITGFLIGVFYRKNKEKEI